MSDESSFLGWWCLGAVLCLALVVAVLLDAVKHHV